MNKGDIWAPLRADHRNGQRIGMCVSGRACYVSTLMHRPVASNLFAGQVFLEGLIQAWNVEVKALSTCVGYRVKELDFQLAIIATGESRKGTREESWYTRFQLLQND